MLRKIEASWADCYSDGEYDAMFVGMVIFPDDSQMGLPTFILMDGIVYEKK